MGTPPGGQPLIYLQIARMLEDDILRGVYREEEQVPSTNELARAFRINPATAAKGINLLAASGVLCWTWSARHLRKECEPDEHWNHACPGRVQVLWKENGPA